MANVVEVTAEELKSRREEILNRLGISLDELRTRAREATLVGEEWKAWEDLRDIAFLLGEDQS